METDQETTKEAPRSRIHSLRVQNVLAIDSVELKPKASGITIIAGKNGAGKSSLLLALYALIDWRTASRKVAKLLRDGQSRGLTEVDLGNGVTIRRTVTERGTSLTVKKDGLTVQSPQSFLDAIAPPDLIDPLAFSAMTPADRRLLMIRVAGLGDELEKASNTVAQKEATRTEVGRDHRQALAALDALPDAPEDTPAERVLVVELAAELDAIQAHKRVYRRAGEEIEALRVAAEDAGGTASAVEAELVGAIATVKGLEDELRACTTDTDVKKAAAVKAAATFAAQIEPTGEQDIRDRIAAADQQNENVRTRDAKEAAAVRSAKLGDIHIAAQEAVEAARTTRDELVKRAEFPLPGLGFDAVDATFDDIRWANIGTAKQMRVGLALGKAQNPGLPVFLMQRAESLDADSLAEADAWAVEEDVQIIAEVVGGEGHEGAFVLEAGRLKKGGAA